MIITFVVNRVERKTLLSIGFPFEVEPEEGEGLHPAN